jgi:haloalkane dehalogenase
MQILRTADEHFADVLEFPYAPGYCEVSDQDGGTLRVAWVEDGPADVDPVLRLDGEPSWPSVPSDDPNPGGGRTSRYLSGPGRFRPVGQTDPDREPYIRPSGGVDARAGVRRAGPAAGDLVGQDWGGLIGLRLAAKHPDRFARIVVANTGLPTGDLPMPQIWWTFREAIQGAPEIQVGRFVEAGCRRPMTDAVRAAYDAPFPDDSYCAAPRAMPGLVPTTPDDHAAEANRAAWKALCASTTPMLVAFSDSDPVTGPMAEIFASQMRGAHGIDHPVIGNAGHFLQEDAGEELAEAIVRFLRKPV